MNGKVVRIADDLIEIQALQRLYEQSPIAYRELVNALVNPPPFGSILLVFRNDGFYATEVMRRAQS